MSDIYLVLGDDRHLREKEISKIRTSHNFSTNDALDVSVYETEDIAECIQSLETQPFLSPKRLVILRNLQKAADDNLGSIVKYVSSPSEFSVFIMCADETFKKTKQCKEIKKNSEIIDVSAPTVMQIKKWIPVYFKKHDIEITHDAVEMIVTLKGNDTLSINKELEKLLGYSGGERITVDIVEKMVGRSPRETVFKLVDAIDDKKPEWAYRILGELSAQKKESVEIIGYLGWYVRVLSKIKYLLAKGRSLREIASEVSYSEGYVRRLANKAKRYTKQKLIFWKEKIYAADREIKTGIKPSKLSLETLLAELMRR